MQEKTQFIETVSDVMEYMASFAGGVVPDKNTDQYVNWLKYIQVKYEEASKRGFWRRLLTKDHLDLVEGDTELYLPVRFQRPNSLYVLVVDGVDLADPDRIPDGQEIYIELDNDPTVVIEDEEVINSNYGRWKISFKKAISSNQEALLWYFSTPPKPTTATDKILLPGDMVAYGALAEHFRSAHLVGSQDDARQEYENRINTYLAMEMIPARHELLQFATNPRQIDRLRKAKAQYAIRADRLNRTL